jgi:hypothetical protein
MREDAHPYTPVWNKYRPVILQLMSAAANGPQQYQLYQHEFKAFSKKEKGGYSFLLEAQHGKAINNIKGSQVAFDLLFVLQQSKTALQLLRDAAYEFSLDKNFVLRVNRKNTEAILDQP